MSNGGTWQPPQPGAAPPPVGPPTGGGSFAPPVTAEPSPPAPGRSKGKVIAAAVGAAAIVGAGVFAISQFTGESASGGAATPEDAGLAFLAAIENEDALGMIDVLLPGERETLRDPATDLAEELRRLEVLSADASLSDIGGIDLVVEDESVETVATNVDDIVNVQITASISGSIDGEALPIGDWIRDNLDQDLSELDTESGPAEADTLPLTAVLEDGRWYLSLFYTAAESIRAEVGEDIPTEGVVPAGGESPEAALDAVLDGVEHLDLEAVIASLNPNEFQALQRYAPLFLDDAQAELDAAGEDVTISISDRTYDVSGSGDTRSVTVSGLTVEVTAEGESATVELRDGCWTASSEGETLNSCELAESMPSLDEVVDDPQQVEDLLASVQATFDDYENPGLIVEQVDGQWFFSPMATGSEQVLAFVRALSREEIEDLQVQITDLVGSLDDDVFGGEAIPVPGADDFELPGADDETSTPTTIAGDEGEVTEDSVVDPSDACWAEVAAAAAGDCFQALVDAGEFDAAFVPWYLRFPECGVAEIGWSGDYYSLPDAEFVALVEEVAPCFETLLQSGEVDEIDLPYEITNPDCLDGRNWYTQTDEAWIDAFDECVLAG